MSLLVFPKANNWEFSSRWLFNELGETGPPFVRQERDECLEMERTETPGTDQNTEVVVNVARPAWQRVSEPLSVGGGALTGDKSTSSTCGWDI